MPATWTEVSWTAHDVDPKQKSPGFVEVADLNNDGHLDVLVGTLVEQVKVPPIPPKFIGALHIYLNKDGGLDNWEEQVPFDLDNGLGFVNDPAVGDFNGDGVIDIGLQTGFLTTGGGAHMYMPGPSFSNTVPFTPETAESEFFFHHLEQTDMDGDGDLDIVTTRASYDDPAFGDPVVGLAVDWYRHDGNGGYQRHVINEGGFGEGRCGTDLALYDVDSDNDLDIVCPQFFGPPAEPSIIWIEQVTAPTAASAGTWQVHEIDSTTGYGFDVDFVDIDADGKDELVYSNHNNQNNKELEGIPSGVYYFELPDDPRNSSQWSKFVIDEGYEVTAPDMGNPKSQGAPGFVAIGDMDGNGLLDMVTSGDGADGLFAIFQRSQGKFERHLISDGDMWGEAMLLDLDGNGTLEVLAAHHRVPALTGVPDGAVRIFEPSFK